VGGVYFRSRWEANVARVLALLLDRGVIQAWAYEPREFEFETIRRGTRFYIPDFQVWSDPERYQWWEVKGWMDKTSKIKLDRFRKFYPEEAARLVIIGRSEYQAFAKWRALISGWEE
jgi:hypothetical protein